MTVWHEIQASRLQKIEPLLCCQELLSRLTNLESTHGSTHRSTHGQKPFRHLSGISCDIDSKFLESIFESTLELTQQNGLKTEVLLISYYFNSWSLSRLMSRLTEFKSTHRLTHSLILLCAGWYSLRAILSHSEDRLTTSLSRLMAWNIFKICRNNL